jgi:hypothetical protein
MGVTTLRPGQAVTTKVIDAVDLRAGDLMLESTYLVYGIVEEVERIWSTDGRSCHYEYRFEEESPLLGTHHLPGGCAVGIVTSISD